MRDGREEGEGEALWKSIHRPDGRPASRLEQTMREILLPPRLTAGWFRLVAAATVEWHYTRGLGPPGYFSEQEHTELSQSLAFSPGV